MKDKDKDLSITDIGNFCLLTEKYKKRLVQNGVYVDENIDKKNAYFLRQCSKLVSEQLKIMDDCQKYLYKYGSNKNNIEAIKEAEVLFKEGIEIMQEVLKGFAIVTTPTKEQQNEYAEYEQDQFNKLKSAEVFITDSEVEYDKTGSY